MDLLASFSRKIVSCLHGLAWPRGEGNSDCLVSRHERAQSSYACIRYVHVRSNVKTSAQSRDVNITATVLWSVCVCVCAYWRRQGHPGRSSQVKSGQNHVYRGGLPLSLCIIQRNRKPCILRTACIRFCGARSVQFEYVEMQNLRYCTIWRDLTKYIYVYYLRQGYCFHWR